MLFWQFFNIFIYVKIFGLYALYRCQTRKNPEKYQINIWMYGYSQTQGTRSKKDGEVRDKSCPVLSTRIWTLSPGLENNQTLKSWSGIFPTILKYMIMLENCQNNISVYGCFPIQGTKFYSCWNLMKPGSQSGTYVSAKYSSTSVINKKKKYMYLNQKFI